MQRSRCRGAGADQVKRRCRWQVCHAGAGVQVCRCAEQTEVQRCRYGGAPDMNWGAEVQGADMEVLRCLRVQRWRKGGAEEVVQSRYRGAEIQVWRC